MRLLTQLRWWNIFWAVGVVCNIHNWRISFEKTDCYLLVCDDGVVMLGGLYQLRQTYQSN